MDVVLDFGDVLQAALGRSRIRLNRDSRLELRHELGPDRYRAVERKLLAYAIVAEDGAVVTVAHPRRRRAA